METIGFILYEERIHEHVLSIPGWAHAEHLERNTPQIKLWWRRRAA